MSNDLGLEPTGLDRPADCGGRWDLEMDDEGRRTGLLRGRDHTVELVVVKLGWSVVGDIGEGTLEDHGPASSQQRNHLLPIQLIGQWNLFPASSCGSQQGVIQRRIDPEEGDGRTRKSEDLRGDARLAGMRGSSQDDQSSPPALSPGRTT